MKRPIDLLLNGAIVLSAALASRIVGAAPALSATPPVTAAAQASAPGGPLMVIGGGRDQDDLMRIFLHLAGGPERLLLIVPLASQDPAKSGAAYVTYMRGLGAHQVQVLLPKAPPTVQERAAIARAGGCFFSGGDQARILSALTPPWQAAFQEASRRGAVMAGTSAGAMIWGDRAISGGDPIATARYGQDARHHGLRTRAGLGVAPGWIVDTHFSQRARLPRLAYAVAESGGEWGLGVDQETAAIIRPDASIEVEGRGTVTLVEAGARAGKVVLPLRDVCVDVLTASDRLTPHHRVSSPAAPAKQGRE